jgi:uncharacterized protein YjbJ (UPF0337 family)
MKGRMRQKWAKLTDSDWEAIAGKRDELLGKLQQRYGYTREQAEHELQEYERTEGHSKVA